MTNKIIIRIASRGQYKVDVNNVALLRELNEIDNQIVTLLMDTESKMQKHLDQMARIVDEQAEEVEDAFIESDLVLPPTDLSLSEAAKLFPDEGIIPW
jgi:replicative DNA helicase